MLRGKEKSGNAGIKALVVSGGAKYYGITGCGGGGRGDGGGG